MHPQRVMACLIKGRGDGHESFGLPTGADSNNSHLQNHACCSHPYCNAAQTDYIHY